jgi:predicted phage tail protein
VALYNSLDNSARNTYTSPRDGSLDYNLPGLSVGQVFGTARGGEIRVAIVDTGTFQDPRSRDEWWQIRPARVNPTATPIPTYVPTATQTTVPTNVPTATPTTPVPLSAPTLISPAIGEITASRPSFAWNGVSGAVRYNIQLSTSAAFGSLNLNQQPSGTSYTVGNALTAGRTYYWRVRAINGAGTSSPWSEVRSFTVAGGLSAPVLNSPADGSSTSDRTPSFSWGSVSGASRYNIQLSTSPTFGSLNLNQTRSGTSYTVGNNLTVGRTYYWRVRAIDAAGNAGPWSAVRSLAIQ